MTPLKKWLKFFIKKSLNHSIYIFNDIVSNFSIINQLALKIIMTFSVLNKFINNKLFKL